MSKDSKSLSEKISELINPNPVWEDPENELSETTAKLVEKSNEGDAEVTPSTVKNPNYVLFDVDDERYKGKKVSRKSFEKGSSKTTFFADVNAVSSDDESSKSKSLSETSAAEESEREESDAGGDEEDTKSTDHRSENSPFKSFKSSHFPAETEKANSVRNQMRLWDNLLEARIQLQKCLIAANKLPPQPFFDAFKRSAGSELQTLLSGCEQEGLTLVCKLMELQTMLLLMNPETKSLSSGKTRKEDEKCLNENDYIPEKKRKLNCLSKEIADQDLNFKKFRDDTLQKWYSRSKASSTKSSNFTAFDLSILKQIEHVLRDKETLIKRTQRKRSSYHAFGVPEVEEAKEEVKIDEEYDCEIFDDDDFYHKLLRELIERKSTDLADPTRIGRQWSELQKLRRKLKKKVDTKASKGRKIRYVVHSKLVNFMAPIPCLWHDSAMDDLYRSLFGKVE